jgi:hypothetical protein
MHKTPFFLLLAAICLGGCRMIRPSDYTIGTPPVTPRLPKMDLLLHEPSFLSLLGNAYAARTNAPLSGPGDWVGIGPGFGRRSAWMVNQKLNDAAVLLEKDMDFSIAENTGPDYGRAKFRLILYDLREPGWGYWVPSALTGFSINLLGLPVTRMQADMELEVEISDANNQTVGKYRGNGSGRAKVGYYNGYDYQTSIRKAHMEAFKAAMADIKAQLAADAARIIPALRATGPLRDDGGYRRLDTDRQE